MGKKVKFEYEGGNVILSGEIIEDIDNATVKIRTKAREYIIYKSAIVK